MVTVFRRSLLSANEASTVHFLGGITSIMAVVYIEGSREDCAWCAIPIVIGILFQLLAAGFVLPIAYLGIILTSKRRKRKSPLDAVPGEGPSRRSHLRLRSSLRRHGTNMG